jgi:hypothetical protein
VRSKIFGIGAASFLCFVFLSSVSFAATITVTSNADSGAGTLRQAVADALNGDEIVFNLSAGNEEITLSSTITLPGSNSITIDGANTAGSGTRVTVKVATPGTTAIRLFSLSAYGTDKTITLRNLTLRGGDTGGTPGSILNAESARGILNIENCTIRDGKADQLGGAMRIQYADSGTTFTVNIVNSTVEACQSGSEGGAIYLRNPDVTLNISGSHFVGNFTTGSTGSGGGAIRAYESNLIIDRSTFSGNLSSNQGGGGAVHTYAGSTTITNSTFASNEASHASGGGGALVLSRSEAINVIANSTFLNNEAYTASAISVTGNSTLTNLTVANNYSRKDSDYSAGAVNITSSTTKIKNCLFARNTRAGANLDFSSTAGAPIDNGYNLVEYSTGYTDWSGPGNITGLQASLNLSDTLADNGTIYGTQTLALSAGSPAINAGNGLPNSAEAIPGRDQRGMVRSGFGPADPSGRRVDIGAYEYDASVGNVISVTTNEGGSVYPQGPAGFATGESQTFVFTPEAGYQVHDVTVNGSSQGIINSYTFNGISSDQTITVTFGDLLHTITAQAGPNGSVSPSGEVFVADGGSKAFTFEADTGYHVDAILVDGVATTEGAGLPSYTYVLSNVTQGHTIEGTFAINTYTLVSTAGANGTISPSGIVTKEYGSNQTYTITPDTGYHVLSVIDNGVINAGTTEYTVSNITADHTIIASFEINILVITSEVFTGNGTIEPYGIITAEYGSERTYVMIPDTGHGVFDVLVDGISVGAVDVYTFEAVAAHHRIVASFEPMYLITAEAGANGTIEPYGITAKVKGASQAFAITPDSGYRILDVVVDGSSAGAVGTYTFSNITANHTITASFELIPVYAPSAEPFSNVTTTVIKANWGANGNPGGTMYYCENVTAGTNSGWITGLNWSSTSLEANTVYEFRVKAREAGGAQESGWTSLGTEETAGYVTAEGSIAGVDIRDGDAIPGILTITVSVTSESVVTASGIQKKAVLGGVKAVYVNDVAVTYEVISMSDTSITVRLGAALAEGTYTIKVITYDTDGTEYVLERTGLRVMAGDVITVGPTLLYPNPYDPLAGDLKITYYLSVDKDTAIYVIDTSGRIVWRSNYISGTNGGKAGYNEVTWNSVGTFGQLQSGAYIISVMEQGTGKLITKTKLMLWKGGAR